MDATISGSIAVSMNFEKLIKIGYVPSVSYFFFLRFSII